MFLQDQLDSGAIAGEQPLGHQDPDVSCRSINDFFPLIVCLNLKRRSDRWRQMQARFLANQIRDVVHFPAIDGTEVPLPQSWPSTPGAYGCLQSHVAIVEFARSLGVSSVLIFEDDVEFANDFQKKLLPVLAHLPTNWQMFFLGAIALEDPVPVSPGLATITKAYSTYAYAIHHTLFDAFIQLNKNSEQLLDINSFILQQNYSCYCASPYLAWVESGYSDAQEKIENHWYLRESLVLFGESANRLLAKTCVFLDLAGESEGQAIENLYFLLDYYREYFQGYLSVCVLEQGKASQLDPGRLPENTRHLLFAEDSTREQNFARAVNRLGKEFDYLILSSNGLYLQPMDFRGNLQMCRRHKLTCGFSRQIQLTAKDSQILKENADGRGLNLSAYQCGEQSGDLRQGESSDCYYFFYSELYLELIDKPLLKDGQSAGCIHDLVQALPCYYAPNSALVLSV
ncbi:glycosyltransferase family 25 protein [Thalassomonas viridans]|uniref:Glycosyltransferase family 25 protein n=1 Tax=Thalassomonas viridans TaxID=137584 RepID=A0AAE9ZAV6_9GAMM|nr:glycosyltransferase family 25 protein [Thalassomonas viridans]WDE08042.1 glycosyltransferase family 25 protein [Thalassomonas viridans]